MYSQKSDSEIWRDFKIGKIEAYEYIYITYLPVLYNYGYKICLDNSLTQDCIQEVFITLLEKKDSLADSDSIKFYLFKALRRRLIRALEKHEKFSTLKINDRIDFQSNFSFDSAFDHEISEERSAELLVVLNALPPRQKEAVTLRFYDNMSYEEIAKIMNIEVTSVYKIIYKAIENLHKKLSGQTFLIYYLLYLIDKKA